MEIERIFLNGVYYHLFHININGKHLCVAEEKLERFIQYCINIDAYDSVQWVDELYGYYVDQDIADTADEEKIKQFVLNILDKD